MDEIDEVKKYSGWKDVQLIDHNNCLLYFQSVFGNLTAINNILKCYTGGIGDYVVATGDNKYYIGESNGKTIYFFAEFDSLKEACEAL